MKRTSIASNGRATSGQKTQLVQVTTNAGRHSGTLINHKLGLDHDGFDRLLQKSGELKTAIAEFTLAKAKELSCSQFSKEVTDSNYQYPKEFKLKTLEEQDQILHTLFPGLGLTDLSSVSRKLPKNAEAYFLIPSWEKIAVTYNEAVERVLVLIKSQRAFYNHREGELGPDRLQEGSKK